MNLLAAPEEEGEEEEEEEVEEYMNKLEFLFAIYKYLKASLFQCQGVVMIFQVGIANTG